ncbi:hypothetical protein CN918_25875 [Priestia megaterium]|nr:hypothetical protein CN918_25875 [Priestia megaterium]
MGGSITVALFSFVVLMGYGTFEWLEAKWIYKRIKALQHQPLLFQKKKGKDQDIYQCKTRFFIFNIRATDEKVVSQVVPVYHSFKDHVLKITYSRIEEKIVKEHYNPKKLTLGIYSLSDEQQTELLSTLKKMMLDKQHDILNVATSPKKTPTSNTSKKICSSSESLKDILLLIQNKQYQVESINERDYYYVKGTHKWAICTYLEHDVRQFVVMKDEKIVSTCTYNPDTQQMRHVDIHEEELAHIQETEQFALILRDTVKIISNKEIEETQKLADILESFNETGPSVTLLKREIDSLLVQIEKEYEFLSIEQQHRLDSIKTKTYPAIKQAHANFGDAKEREVLRMLQLEKQQLIHLQKQVVLRKEQQLKVQERWMEERDMD